MREGTPASRMDNQVNGLDKKARVRRVLDISDVYEKEYYESYIGQELEGLVEVHKDNSVIVLTSNYIPVIVDNVELGTFVDVKITEATSTYLKSELL